jgi:hypothetical protein
VREGPVPLPRTAVRRVESHAAGVETRSVILE